MLRIRQRVGLNLSNAATTSAGWAPLYWMLPRFARVFITIRGPQAHWDSVESDPKEKARAWKVPPTPGHVSRQPTTLARPMRGSPRKRGFRPPCAIPPRPVSADALPPAARLQARAIAPREKIKEGCRV